MNISNETRLLAARAERELADIFAAIDEVSRYRTEKLLDIYRENRVSEGLFAASTGYGYGDRGRDTIDKICAEVMGAEAGFMRPSIMSGTHALAIGLFGILRPGDIMLYTDGAKGTDLLITWLYKLSLGTDRNYKLASVIGILVFVISATFSLLVYNKSSAVQGEDNFQ